MTQAKMCPCCGRQAAYAIPPLPIPVEAAGPAAPLPPDLDVVRKLEHVASNMEQGKFHDSMVHACDEAASEIERLRKALHIIGETGNRGLGWTSISDGNRFLTDGDIARAALDPTPSIKGRVSENG